MKMTRLKRKALHNLINRYELLVYLWRQELSTSLISSHVDNAACGFLCRGQESAGIVTSEGNNAKSFHVHKGMGMINNVFTDDSMKKLKGKWNCELFKLVKSDITSIQAGPW